VCCGRWLVWGGVGAPFELRGGARGVQVDLWVKASVGEEKSVRGGGGALVTKEGYIEVVGCVWECSLG